ncbi:MAG: putative DNA binding domain-containing protein [Dehalococcoidia bacterium]|nr:MAG: putative DNA binding domain-containing protein [Dehalococcoidia bacterium]
MTNGDLLRRLDDLVTFPRENLETELKSWLNLGDDMDRANLARALIALANHGGGYVLIGFVEKKGEWLPAEPRPTDLSGYSVDDCNSVLARYAEPQFHCDIYHATRHDSGLRFPVVVVPGGHGVPIRSRRDDPQRKHIRQNEYYIRRPGPKSEPPQSGQEWDDLIRRCIQAAREELLEDIRRIIYGPGGLSPPSESAVRELDAWEKESEERWLELIHQQFPSIHQSPFAFGVWMTSYILRGKFHKPSLGDLLDILSQVKGHETGWPPWWVPTRSGIAPHPYKGAVECSLIDISRDSAHSDFWRASRSGRMFLVRGYQEDSPENETYKPGTVFDLTLPVWRVGEVLLHASRLAAALQGGDAGDSEVQVKMRWTGLKGRELVTWAQPPILLDEGRICHQEEVESELIIPVSDISSQLPEFVAQLTRPLYEVFDFFQPSMGMFHQQLSRMRSSRI